jgi:pilus assembly protein CpaB
MSVRRLLLLVVALVVAGLTVQVTRGLLRPPAVAAPGGAGVEAAAPAPKVTRVLVAAADLPAGTLVQASHLRWRAWPDDDGLPPGYTVEGSRGIDSFVGAVVRQGLRTGEPVVEGRLVRPQDRGFLAAVLTPGRRAVSVAITGVTGIAGFVFPGDRVDVILTSAIRQGDGSDQRQRHASETVLSDVRVLALDQRTGDEKGEVRPAQTATLEVTPRQAEAVAVASGIGQLSFSLCSLATPPAGGVQMAASDGAATQAVLDEAPGSAADRGDHTITWDSDISRAVAPPPTPDSSGNGGNVNPSENASGVVKVQVVRGAQSTEVSFHQR